MVFHLAFLLCTKNFMLSQSYSAITTPSQACSIVFYTCERSDETKSYICMINKIEELRKYTTNNKQFTHKLTENRSF